LLGTLTETISSEALFNKERSTTIESITKKKDLGEEASRVGEIRNGRHILFGKRIMYEDIV
jgi:hypothetical protein